MATYHDHQSQENGKGLVPQIMYITNFYGILESSFFWQLQIESKEKMSKDNKIAITVRSNATILHLIYLNLFVGVCTINHTFHHRCSRSERMVLLKYLFQSQIFCF